MGVRFWRRVKIAPGLTLNLSKTGGSLSFGPRGAKVTVGPRGRRATVGIPGTGLFYTQASSNRGPGRQSGQRRQTRHADVAAVPVKDRLTLGFFKRLVTPAGERAFVDGCRELAQGHYAASLPFFDSAAHLADGAFAAGFLHLKQERTDKAIPLLEQAVRDSRQLGRQFTQYGLELTLNLPVTEEVEAHVGPTLRGALLTLVEAYQLAEDWDHAHACVQRLRKLQPDDVVILLSLIELIWEANHGNEETCRHIVRLTRDVGSDCFVHTTVRLYKARALNALGMHTAARDLLTETLRRKKDRSANLMNALRYERSLAYHGLGHEKRATADMERIYASDPDFTTGEDLL